MVVVPASRYTAPGNRPRRLSPFAVPGFLADMAAGRISIRHGFHDPLGALVTACAASAQALGDAARLIRSGEADIVVCGGAEACIDRVSLGTFAAARTMSTGFNDHPARASRPFDTGRDGFVMREGAGMLVIEDLEHALQRRATPIAEVLGYGTSAAAHRMTSPADDGAGGRRAMELAIRQANREPGMIGHLNAHATSTPVGDISELAAIKAIRYSVRYRSGPRRIGHQVVDRAVAWGSLRRRSHLHRARTARSARASDAQFDAARFGGGRRRHRRRIAPQDIDGIRDLEWFRF